MTQQSLFDARKHRIPKKARTLPLDIIYTFANFDDSSTFTAHTSGWKIGIQSSSGKSARLSDSVRHTERWSWRFSITFIDNDYFNYNHAHHLSVVKEFKPKYCTVRDAMTPEQCAKDQIQYYPLEQILDWAEELDQYAENVMIIPKYPCLDKIPEKFMLGYSIPTSHGGTPLPLSMFQGRRVHLLGGSWKNQLAAIYELHDDVISMDNNHLHKIAQYAQYYLPDGETNSLRDIAPIATNPLYICLALSFGNVAAKVKELYPPVKQVEQNDPTSDSQSDR